MIRKTMGKKSFLAKYTITTHDPCSLPLPTGCRIIWSKPTQKRDDNRHGILMARHIANRHAFDPPISLIIHCRNGSRFAAAAHAQTARIGAIGSRKRQACMVRDATIVPTNKALGLSSDPSSTIVARRGNACELSTSAMAIAIGNFKGRIVGCGCEKLELWGIIHGVFSASTLLTTPPSDFRRCGGNSFAGLYYSTNELVWEGKS